jgi:hypothetical protein
MVKYGGRGGCVFTPRHGPHTEHRFQQLLYWCMRVLRPLPSNGYVYGIRTILRIKSIIYLAKIKQLVIVTETQYVFNEAWT